MDLFDLTLRDMRTRSFMNNIACLNNESGITQELLNNFDKMATAVMISYKANISSFYTAMKKYSSQDNANSAVYYYHSDHLGSASWITNGSGTPVQHLQYMPYGEPFVNERTGSYEERFCSPLLHYRSAYRANSYGNAIANLLGFSYSPLLHYRKAYRANSCGNAIANSLNLLHTGKERDSETGFSYFGARYYDSDFMTGWLSVDPMADKYPSLSPYAYCAWNPVKLVDPDGEDIYQLDVSTGSLTLSQKTKDKTDKIIAGSYNRVQNVFEEI